MGRMKLSTKADTRSVGLLFADMIGRPGGGLVFLCTFGSRYSCGVLKEEDM